MAYQKRNFKKDQLLTADDLNAMDDQIALNEESAKKTNQSLKDKFDKSNVVQSTGDAEDKVMSQASATKEFGKLSEEIDYAINHVITSDDFENGVFEPFTANKVDSKEHLRTKEFHPLPFGDMLEVDSGDYKTKIVYYSKYAGGFEYISETDWKTGVFYGRPTTQCYYAVLVKKTDDSEITPNGVNVKAVVKRDLPKVDNLMEITDLVRPTMSNKYIMVDGNVGTVPTINTETNVNRCSTAMLYCLNRSFAFLNSDGIYEIGYAVFDEDKTLLEQVMYTNAPYIEINKNSGVFFAFTIRRADNGEIADFDDVVKRIKIYTSHENIDKKSDYPLIFAIYHVQTPEEGYPLNTEYWSKRLYTAYLVRPKYNLEITLKNNNALSTDGFYLKVHQLLGETGQFVSDTVWMESNSIVVDNTGDIAVRWNIRKNNADADITKADIDFISENITIRNCDNRSNTTFVNERDSYIKVVSHRGDVYLAPENTMAGLRSGYARGFRAFEIDVQMTSDNVPVLCHDGTIDRTSNGSGSVSQMTYAQLLQYDFGSWFSKKFEGEKILTFEDCVKFCAAHNCEIQIELKADANWNQAKMKILFEILRRYNMLSNVFWVSFNYSALQLVIEEDETQTVAVNEFTKMNQNTVNLCNGLKTGKNKVYLALNIAGNYDETYLPQLIENEIPLHYYLVDRMEEYYQYLPKYMGAITTNALNPKAGLNA